jgi:hypothetical protein
VRRWSRGESSVLALLDRRDEEAQDAQPVGA